MTSRPEAKAEPAASGTAAEAELVRALIARTRALAESSSPLVRISGERSLAILVDLLMDLDPVGSADIWPLLHGPGPEGVAG